MSQEVLLGAYVFILAIFLGLEVIGRVPSTLHTPLMSGTNAIHGIVLLGGIIVTWSQLDLGPAFFLQRLTEDSYMPKHMLVGLVKAPVFALVVAAIGCRQGLAVGGDVESLGRRVTAAVVQAIFAIIALDALFAMTFLEIGL